MAQKGHGSTSKAVQPYLRFDCDRDIADNICCYNRHYAEPSGYWRQQSLFLPWLKQHAADEPAILYDSVHGKPCFTAPVGRSLDSFIRETEAHGWPSFRTEECNWDVVRCLEDGECITIDGVHLGHNIPDENGHRFCINLVSIAGLPPTRRWSDGDFRQALRQGGSR